MSNLFKKISSSIGGLFKKGGGVRNWFSKDNFIHALEKMNLIRDGKINPTPHINYYDPMRH
jgi:hypothetical protein